MDQARRDRVLQKFAEKDQPKPLPEKDRKYPTWKILGAASASSAAGALAGNLISRQIRKARNLPPAKFKKVHKALLVASPILALGSGIAHRYAGKEMKRLSTIPKDKKVEDGNINSPKK